jgi:hypothetical protein
MSRIAGRIRRDRSIVVRLAGNRYQTPEAAAAASMRPSP